MGNTFMQNLLNELKIRIIETLQLTDISPEEISEDGRLVGEVLDIDSIDILELVMMVEEKYSVRIDNKELGARVFSSLRTLAEYIHENRSEAAA